jgi:hypothetical protein
MNGEVMTKLHELAKLMRGAVSAGVIKQHSAEVEIIQWADTIDEYLAAPTPPTSELVGRLLALAQRQNLNDMSDADVMQTFLEAAERELAEANARADRAERHKQGFVDQAVQEQRARLAAEKRAEARETQVAAVRALVHEALADVSNQRAAIGPQRGMHVPWHGRFSGTNPSACKDIDRTLTEISKALAAPAPSTEET